jgi:hypothetical protein
MINHQHLIIYCTDFLFIHYFVIENPTYENISPRQEDRFFDKKNITRVLSLCLNINMFISLNRNMMVMCFEPKYVRKFIS